MGGASSNHPEAPNGEWMKGKFNKNLPTGFAGSQGRGQSHTSMAGGIKNRKDTRTTSREKLKGEEAGSRCGRPSLQKDGALHPKHN